MTYIILKLTLKMFALNLLTILRKSNAHFLFKCRDYPPTQTHFLNTKPSLIVFSIK